MKKLLQIVALSLLSFGARGQFYEIGLGGSGTLFHGDVGGVLLQAEGARGLVPQDVAGQITLRRQFNWHWSTRMTYTYGYLTANDAWATDDFKSARNIAVRTEFGEFSYLAEFNFWPYGTGTKNNKSFYIFGGLGLTAFTPRGLLGDQWYDLRELGTEGQQTELTNQLFYNTFTLSTPFGMGYRQSISRDFSLTAEVGWRRHGSDYLDDTGGLYVDAADLEELRGVAAGYFSNPGDVPFQSGLYRGNADTKDWSIFAGITLFYNLSPRNERCSGF